MVRSKRYGHDGFLTFQLTGCYAFLHFRTHMQDLRDVTNNVHYENFRYKKLANVSVTDGKVKDGSKYVSKILPSVIEVFNDKQKVQLITYPYLSWCCYLWYLPVSGSIRTEKKSWVRSIDVVFNSILRRFSSYRTCNQISIFSWATLGFPLFFPFIFILSMFCWKDCCRQTNRVVS